MFKLTFIKGFKELFKLVPLSIKEIFSPRFITKRYYLHLVVTAVLMLLPNYGLNLLFCPTVLKVVLLGFLSWFINMRWETYHSNRGNVYDDIDVLTGIYAGILIALVL
jgi:hypothetical protein